MFLAGVLAAVALPSSGATCAQKQAAAKAYAAGMAKARAAYFRTHRGTAARKKYVAAQAARLAALEGAALCSTTTSAASEPLPAPAPAANEHFTFSDELTQSARDEAQGYATFAVEDEQKLLGVQLEGIDVFVSTDATWLAQHECAYTGQSGSCVSSTAAHYASSLVDHVPGALFVYWASNDWSGVNTPLYEKQKIMGNAVFSLFQDQIVGNDGDVGPVWLLAGGAEVIGYHVSSDRNFRSYADNLADMRQNIKALTTPLEKIQTWADYGLVGHWYLAGAADRLLTDAPEGIRSLVDYYAAIGKGAAWQDAFRSAFGMTVDQFYADFAAYKAGL